MENTECNKCHLTILEDPLLCDGICGNQYHRDCARRMTRQAINNSYTCPTCTDIKPCHVLKAFLVINSKLDAFQDKTSDLEQSLHSIKADFNLLLTDRETILSSIDQLIDTNRSLEVVLSKFADLAKTNNSLTKRLESTLVDIDLSPDLSPIRDEISNASSALQGLQARLREMVNLPAILNSAPPSSSLCTSRSPDHPSTCLDKLPEIHSCPTDSIEPISTSPTTMPPLSTSHNAAPLPRLEDTPYLPTDSSLHHTSSNVPVSNPNPNPLPVSDSSSNPVSITWIRNEPVESTSLYVGRCEPSTTIDSIKLFISSQLLIPVSKVRCRKLVNPNRPLAEYSFVSFKVDVPITYYQSALSHPWPSPSHVSLFRNRSKHGNVNRPRTQPLPPKNFRSPNPLEKT